jgi:site-specific recombinase XerD
MSNEIVSTCPDRRLPPSGDWTVAPAIIAKAGGSAAFVWEEFFGALVRNPHTRRAYESNVRRFLNWCDASGVVLNRVTPAMVGCYLDHHPGSPSTKNQHLAAIRRFFDLLVVRHAIALNPASSVRGERLQVHTGKTPEIPIEHVRTLIGSVDISQVVGLRDRAAIGVMVFTACRVGAVARLQLASLEPDGSHWKLRLEGPCAT